MNTSADLKRGSCRKQSRSCWSPHRHLPIKPVSCWGRSTTWPTWTTQTIALKVVQSKCLSVTQPASFPLVLPLHGGGGSLQAAFGRSLLQAQFARPGFLHAKLSLFLLLSLLLLGVVLPQAGDSRPDGFGPETWRLLRRSTGTLVLTGHVIHIFFRTPVSVQSRWNALIAALSHSEARLAVRLVLFLFF